MGLLGLVAIPGLAYYIFSKQDVRQSSYRPSVVILTDILLGYSQMKYDWTAKRKGESLTARN